MKNKLTRLVVTSVAAFLMGGTAIAPTIVRADPTIEQDILPGDEGSPYPASHDYIIAHETGNPSDKQMSDPLGAETNYMKNNWFNAYTTFMVGSGGRIKQMYPDGYVSWGALNANPYSPAQVELTETDDPATFQKDYASYVWLLRTEANKFGIPLTLDTAGDGIKTHQWVSDNLGGDHQDPVGYLASHGISQAQFAHDLAYGISTNTPSQQPSNAAPDQILTNGSTVKTDGIYQVTSVDTRYNAIASSELAGGYPNGLNYIDAGPLVKVDRNGNRTADQNLYAGDYFVLPGQYRVNNVDIPSDGYESTIGNYDTWLACAPATEVAN